MCEIGMRDLQSPEGNEESTLSHNEKKIKLLMSQVSIALFSKPRKPKQNMSKNTLLMMYCQL